MSKEPDSGYARLDDQIRWYDTKSTSSQRWHRALKLLEIICAALIPLASAFLEPLVPGLLGVAILILEGVQNLNQLHHNWVTYRSTCEALRHEKFMYLGKSGVYDLSDDEREKLLVERVEQLISTEHSKWLGSRERSRQSRDEQRVA